MTAEHRRLAEAIHDALHRAVSVDGMSPSEAVQFTALTIAAVVNMHIKGSMQKVAVLAKMRAELKDAFSSVIAEMVKDWEPPPELLQQARQYAAEEKLTAEEEADLMEKVRATYRSELEAGLPNAKIIAMDDDNVPEAIRAMMERAGQPVN